MDFKFKVENDKKIYNILKDNNVSETIINRLRRDMNLVLLNGKPSRVVDFAKKGSELIIKVYDKETNKINKTYNKIEILYEDEYILAVNKPPFVSSIPNKYKISIASDILGYLAISTYMPINRLDTNTSGILLIAKTPLMQHKLSGNFKKTYLAVLTNKLNDKLVTVNEKIGEHQTKKSLRQIRSDGKDCTTIFNTIEEFKNYTLCEIELLTGRTHQIRVHSSFLNAPILGDVDYGASPTNLINRQALHAYKVEFIHPFTNKLITITAPLSEDINNTILQLRNQIN